MGNVLTRPPIDWSKPVQWMNGDPAQAERIQGFVLITLGDKYPKEIEPIMKHKHFKDSLVVHEDTGAPIISVTGNVEPEAWIENRNRERSMWEDIEGSF